MKRIICLFLSLVMVISTLATVTVGSISAFAKDYEKGDIIEFGSYPQTLVTDSATKVAVTKLLSNGNTKYYKYYWPTNNDVGTNMLGEIKYADVDYGTNRYRIVRINMERPVNNNWYNKDLQLPARTYKQGSTYIFKYEPIKWRVLDPSTGLVMSENILDSQTFNDTAVYLDGEWYQDTDKTKAAFDYSVSSLREWANFDFLRTAFNNTEIGYITPQKHNVWNGRKVWSTVSIYDRVFLPQVSSLTDTEYGFKADLSQPDGKRAAACSDYAACQHGYEMTDYWTGTANGQEGELYYVNESGKVLSDSKDYAYTSSEGGYMPVLVNTCIVRSNQGFRPAVCIDLEKASTYKRFRTNDAFSVSYGVGTYPSVRVRDEDLISTLDNVTKRFKSYGYYMKNESDSYPMPSDCMEYADFFYGGSKYRAVNINSERPGKTGTAGSHSYVSENGYYDDGGTYYFKYEPLYWTPIYDCDDYICAEMIDSQPFNEFLYYASDAIQTNTMFKNRDANEYHTSSLKRFVEKTFFATAFSEEQQKAVSVTVPSKDIIEPNMASLPRNVGTDYALSQGLNGALNTCLLSDAVKVDYSTYQVYAYTSDPVRASVFGLRESDVYSDSTYYGVRPVLNFNSTKKTDIAASGRLDSNYIRVYAGRERITNDEDIVNVTPDFVEYNRSTDVLTPAEGFELEEWSAENYAFVGWFQDGVQMSSFKSYAASRARILNRDAYYEVKYKDLNEVRIHAVVLDETVASASGGGTYHIGESVTVTTQKYDNTYQFDGWYIGNQKQSENETYTFEAEKTCYITARYTKIKKRLTVYKSDNDDISKYCNVTAQTTSHRSLQWNETERCWYVDVPVGEEITLTGSVAYSQAAVFSRWHDLGGFTVSSDSVYTFNMPDYNMDIVASFQQLSTNIKIEAIGNGTVDSSDYIDEDVWKLCGDRTYTAEPGAGYKFKGWLNKGGDTLSYDATLTVKGDKIRDNDELEYKALFIPDAKYTVNVVKDGEGTITSVNATGVDYGTQCSLTAVPATGWHFEGWYDATGENLVAQPTENPLRFEIYEDWMLTAKFARNKYELVLDTSCTDSTAGGTVSGAGLYYYGTEVKVSATPNEFYKFIGWYNSDGSLYTTGDTFYYDVERDDSLTAKFEPLKSYNVNVTVEGNGDVAGAGKYLEGAEYELSAVPANDSTIFVGYYENGELIYDGIANYNRFLESYDINGVANSDRDITAVFRDKKTYTVTVNCDKPDAITVDGKKYTAPVKVSEGSVLELRAENYISNSSTAGSIFDGFYDENNHRVDLSYTQIFKDYNLTAKYTDIPFTKFINITVEGKGKVGLSEYYDFSPVQLKSENENVIVYGYDGAEGETCTFSYEEPDGYTFDGLYDEAGTKIIDPADPGHTNVIVATGGTMNLKAKFIPDPAYQFVIKASASGNGSVSGAGTYTNGSSVTLKATANSNSRFVGWYESGTKVSDNAEYTFTAFKDRSLVAKFEDIPEYCEITVKTTEGGYAMGSGTYQKGQKATLTAIPEDGYEFVAWNDGVKDIYLYSEYTFKPTTDITLTARFRKKDGLTYKVEVEPAYFWTASAGKGSGTAEGSGTYAYNKKVTVKATPDENSVFIGWWDYDCDNLISNDAEYSFNVEEDIFLYAVFSKKDAVFFRINLETTGDGSGTVTGSGDYAEGVYACLSATPDENSTFDGWYKNGSKVSSNKIMRIYGVSQDDTYVAKFSKKENADCTILIKTSGNGSASGAGTYAADTDVELKAVPESDSVFKGWYDENDKLVSDKADYTFKATSSLKLTAKFVPSSYKVTVNKNGNGNGTVSGGGTYKLGSKATVSASPDSDSSFDGWFTEDTLVSKDASYTFDVTDDTVITARFTLKEKESSEPITELTEGATAEQVEKFITSLKNDNDPAGTTFSFLLAKQAKIKKTSIKIAWKAPAGAVKYIIYGNKCGKKNRYKKITETTVPNYTAKGLKKNTYYKFIIAAFDKDGKLLGTSNTLHIATAGGKRGNAKAVKVRKTRVTLKKGKTFSLKGKMVKASKKQTIATHRKVRYESTNQAVATVNAKGVIKAKKKGTCVIYVYAQNGVYKKVTVKVK